MATTPRRGSPPDRLLIVVVTLLAHLPALRNGFIWDDDHHVTDNVELRSTTRLASIWFEPGAKEHRYDQYYPLVLTTFWIEHHVFGAQPFGYHLVNVALHALAAVLILCLLRRLEVPGAVFAALAFALHPVHVATVDWISETKNLQSAVFYLGAALAYSRSPGSIPARLAVTGNALWYVASLAPNDAASESSLGNLLMQSSRTADAILHFEKALRLDPRAVATRNALAWIRATHPDASLRADKQDAIAGQLEQHLESYRSRKPWRQAVPVPRSR